MTEKEDAYTVFFQVSYTCGPSQVYATTLTDCIVTSEEVLRETKKERKRERDRICQRRWRQRNTIRDIWNHLRSNSARRNIICTISLEDFTEWCIQTGYHLLRGRARDSATIDRKIPELGYVKGNLQILSKVDNSYKRWLDTPGWKPIINDKLF